MSGALEDPSIRRPIVKDGTQYALALISGWANKDKKPFTDFIDELESKSAHNQEILEAAVEKIKELNALAETVRQATVKLDAQRDTFNAEQAEVERKLHDRETLVKQREAAHASAAETHAKSVKKEMADLGDWQKGLDARDKAITEREALVKQTATALIKREAAVSEREDAVKLLVTQLRNIVNKSDYDV